MEMRTFIPFVSAFHVFFFQMLKGFNLSHSFFSSEGLGNYSPNSTFRLI